MFQAVVPGAAFVAVLAPSVTVGIVDGTVGFRLAVEEEAVLLVGHHHAGLRLELNLLALVLFLALRRVGKSAAIDGVRNSIRVASNTVLK